MAAALIKGINARIRANPVTDYFCSTRECHLKFSFTRAVPSMLIAMSN